MFNSSEFQGLGALTERRSLCPPDLGIRKSSTAAAADGTDADSLCSRLQPNGSDPLPAPPPDLTHFRRLRGHFSEKKACGSGWDWCLRMLFCDGIRRQPPISGVNVCLEGVNRRQSDGKLRADAEKKKKT
ncbi:hypothetical protein FQA47_021877 [Oryzias melastigma]|uniref:Uncharacterized protein n=1 Tax=Oryzias melastigma TaxID=30732 RepID=A0A834C2P0_ORYME|nr:hypothetical protein FQA47_021877 [Oryzias melastigma]